MKRWITVKLTAQRKNIGKWNMSSTQIKLSHRRQTSYYYLRKDAGRPLYLSQVLLMRITYALALNGPVWEICLVTNGLL